MSKELTCCICFRCYFVSYWYFYCDIVCYCELCDFYLSPFIFV